MMADNKKTRYGANGIAAFIVLASVLGCLPICAHADQISLRNGSVYDGAGNKITDGTAYRYASGSPVCPVNSVVSPTGQQAYINNHDFLTYYFKNRRLGVATVVIRGNHDNGYKDAIILKFKISANGKAVPQKSLPNGNSSSGSSGTSTSSSQASSSSHSQSNTTLSIAATTASISEQTYNGTALMPTPKVVLGGKTLRSGSDYIVKYQNNTNTGTASATITGTGNYKGSKTLTFKINPANISSSNVSGVSDKTYTGNAITQSPTIKAGSRVLKNGTDYTVSYKNNKNSGTATIILTGKGNYKGTLTKTFKITKASISKAAISVPNCYTNSLSKVQPAVTVKLSGKTLKKGTDYTVTYSNNVNPGKATVKISGKGQYSGTAKKNFTLVNLGDDLARQSCRQAFSQDKYCKGGAGKMTAVYKKTWAANGKPHANDLGRSCDAAVCVAVRASKYDKSYPGGQESQLKYLRSKKGKAVWTQIASFKTRSGKYNSIKSKLRPGDVVHIDNGNAHTFVYVGKTIANEIYKKYLKGTEADRGAPIGDFVSAYHGGLYGPGITMSSGSTYIDKFGGDCTIWRCTAPKASGKKHGAKVS